MAKPKSSSIRALHCFSLHYERASSLILPSRSLGAEQPARHLLFWGLILLTTLLKLRVRSGLLMGKPICADGCAWSSKNRRRRKPSSGPWVSDPRPVTILMPDRVPVHWRVLELEKRRGSTHNFLHQKFSFLMGGHMS